MDHHRYDLLPQDTVLLIHSYLDGETIGNTAQTCASFNKVAHKVPHYLKWMKVVGIHNQRVHGNQQLAFGKKILKWTFFSVVHEFICVTCCMLFTFLVAVKLDKDSEVSWTAVFLPLWIIFWQLIVAPVAFFIICKVFKHDYRNNYCPPDARYKEGFLMKTSTDSRFFSMLFIAPSRIGHKVILFTPILLAFTFFVLLFLQLSDMVEAWWSTFAVLFTFAIYLTVFPGAFHDFSCTGRTLLSCSCFPMFLFLSFLAIKLQYLDFLSWANVMSPLLAFTSYCLVLCVALYVVDKRGEGVLQTLQESEATPKFFGFVGGIVLLTLLLVEVLLVIQLETHSLSYKLVCLPLFALELLGLCTIVVVYLRVSLIIIF